MWIAGFTYVVVSTMKVQEIMNKNDAVLEEKIVKHTKKIRSSATRQMSNRPDSANRSNMERVGTQGNDEMGTIVDLKRIDSRNHEKREIEATCEGTDRSYAGDRLSPRRLDMIRNRRECNNSQLKDLDD